MNLVLMSRNLHEASIAARHFSKKPETGDKIVSTSHRDYCLDAFATRY